MVLCCSALKKCYRDVLRDAGDKNAVFVLLDGTEELLLERLQTRTGHFMPSALLCSQLAILERPDPAVERSFVVSIDQSPEGIVDEILVSFGAKCPKNS